VGEVGHGDGPAIGPRHPDVEGVQQMVDLVDPFAVQILEAESGRRGVGQVMKVPCLGFEGVDALFDVGTSGVDGGNVGLGLVDVEGGFPGPPSGGVVVAEAGSHGLVVGLPHGRAQFAAELVLDLGDGVGMRLPVGPGGGEGGLKVGEFGGGLGSPLGAVGEVVDEIMAA
jgi:hypothetical protein